MLVGASGKVGGLLRSPQTLHLVTEAFSYNWRCQVWATTLPVESGYKLNAVLGTVLPTPGTFSCSC